MKRNAHGGKEYKETKEASGFVGYRLVEFGQAQKGALAEIAERLIPHERVIVEDWIRIQFSIWRPPSFSRADLKHLFGDLFHHMLLSMKTGRLEEAIGYLESAGAALARKRFPYEALIISLHFLEESYIRFLLDPPSDKTLTWLQGMDEFLHAALAAIATSYFQAHRKELLEEAEVGRIVQEGLLPDIPKTVLDLEIAYIYLAAGERARVGGDLVDLFTLDSRQAAFIVGDLSGHGLEAAIDATMIRSLFRGFLRENPDLAIAMGRLNRALEMELAAGQFATAVAGTYGVSGHLRLVNAGHPYPVLCDDECRLITKNDTLLAVDTAATYSINEMELQPGGLLLAYTDGLTEARNDGGFFGEERIMATLADVKNAPPRAIAEHLRDEASRFAGGQLADDVAILVFKRAGNRQSRR